MVLLSKVLFPDETFQHPCFSFQHHLLFRAMILIAIDLNCMLGIYPFQSESFFLFVVV